MQTDHANMGRLITAWAKVLGGALPPMTFEGSPVPIEALAAPDGFLPLFLAEADVIWEKMAGRSSGLLLERDPAAALQVQVRVLPAIPVSGLLLCMSYAAERDWKGEPTLKLDGKVAAFEHGHDRYVSLGVGVDLTQLTPRSM